MQPEQEEPEVRGVRAGQGAPLVLRCLPRLPHRRPVERGELAEPLPPGEREVPEAEQAAQRPAQQEPTEPVEGAERFPRLQQEQEEH